MADENDIGESVLPAKWGRALRLFGGAALLLLMLSAIVAYINRVDLATGFIQDMLDDYEVQAQFDVKKIGLRTQRIENLVIGDPSNPDFTAKWVEVDIALKFFAATPRDIRASGVRVFGEFKDGKLSFGDLDKFADPQSDTPFTLPDIAMDFDDTQLRIATDWGILGAGLNGSGALRQGFEGNLALRSPRFGGAACAADVLKFDGRYKIESKQPNIIGPLTANHIKCTAGNLAVNSPKLDVDARLSETFDSWLGDVIFSAGALSSGEILLGKPHGIIKIDGNAKRTNFESELQGAKLSSDVIAAQNLQIGANGRVGFAQGGVEASAKGNIRLRDARADKRYLQALGNVGGMADDTPIGPLLAKMLPALRDAAGNFALALNYDASLRNDGGFDLLLDGLSLRSRSGARFAQNGVAGASGNNGNWQLSAPFTVDLAGLNLPTGRLSLLQAGPDGLKGQLEIQSFVVPGASLTVPGLSFASNAGGAWQFGGRAQMSGPFSGGSVKGLDIPVEGGWKNANLSLIQSCQNLSFQEFRYAALSLTAQSLRLCPNGRGAIVQSGQGGTKVNAALPNFRVNGSFDGESVTATGGRMQFDLENGLHADDIEIAYGAAPIRIKAPKFDFSFDNGFKSQNVTFEIAADGEKTRFDIGEISGSIGKTGLSGRLENAGGKIANVPLVMDEAAGDWTFVDGIFELHSELRVTDAEQVDRFKPMKVPDALISFDDGVLSAIANLYEPTTNTQVASVDIRHQLSSGAGRALLSVDDLEFNDRLQPEMVTPLTLGVVQNVKGKIYGDGQIKWDNSKDGIVSTGRFGTNNLDLAAAFGPVRGLKTELVFSDLLGLETFPTQIAKIQSINPGVEALNGVIKYRLLPGQKVEIEGGSWPFAGGELRVRHTIWDMAVDTPRELVLEVDNIQVGQFIEQFDLSNVTATGVFDGKLPMVFDADGGKIIGGELIAKAGGGNISYIGDLSYKDLSFFANFAFDALRSIDYTGLRIGMNGQLGGEIITDITFEGIKQGKGAHQNFITKQIADVPIKFNIRIEASFFELFGSVKSFYDPEVLVQQNLVEIQRRRDAFKNAKTVGKDGINGGDTASEEQ